MKSAFLENFIEKRIEENKNLFTRKEMECIQSNKDCIYKIYLLGAINGSDCYKS